MTRDRTAPTQILGDLPVNAFFYASTPMLVIAADGRVLEVNIACRALMGSDIAGCKGQHFT